MGRIERLTNNRSSHYNGRMTTEPGKRRTRFRTRLLITTVAAFGAAVLTAILLPRQVERAPAPEIVDVSDTKASPPQADAAVPAAGEANDSGDVSLEAPEERTDGVLSVPQIVKQYDEDKDGKLQRSEAPLLMKPFFARMDINEDGGIDQDEAIEMERRRRVRDTGGQPEPQ